MELLQDVALLMSPRWAASVPKPLKPGSEVQIFLNQRRRAPSSPRSPEWRCAGRRFARCGLGPDLAAGRSRSGRCPLSSSRPRRVPPPCFFKKFPLESIPCGGPCSPLVPHPFCQLPCLSFPSLKVLRGYPPTAVTPPQGWLQSNKCRVQNSRKETGSAA